MIQNDMPSKCEAIVGAWNKATKMNLNPWSYERKIMELFEAARMEYTPDDFATIGRWMMLKNRQASERRYQVEVSLFNVLKDPAKFDSDLNTARAVMRNHKPQTDRQSVLEATGRGEEAMPEARRISADDCIAAMEKALKGN